MNNSDSIKKFSQLSWHAINSKIQTENVQKVSIQEIDEPEVDKKSDSKLFRIDHNSEMRLAEFENDSIQTSIVYEMNLDL